MSQHHGVVSFAVEGVAPQALESILGAQNIAVRAGLHCAPWVHEFMGTQSGGGTVRVSPGCFSEIDDVTALVSSVREAVGV